MTSPTTPTFDDLKLIAPLLRAIKEQGYETPSPIQQESIPYLLDGHDLLGQAQTGTGKTAAFALPFLNNLDVNSRDTQIMVLAPTRELAIQVAEAFQVYARYLKGFHVLPIYGGQSIDIQLRHLRRGVHVVVGTPGRVMDHLRRGTLSLKNLKGLVLDEADEMLRMGFIDDVEWILDHTPKERQIALFSATMPSVIRKVASQYLNNPKEIKIKTKTSTVENITQHYLEVSPRQKLDALTRILEAEDIEASIIFARTKTATVELTERLEARGYACGTLNGDMTQAMRERTIAQLKSKKLELVVATDVAARGLDIPHITHVFNYDIPTDTEAYVHRIGRTGRAGRQGNAILFMAPREKRMLRAIEKATRQTITPMQLPCAETIANRRIEQFKQKINSTIETKDLSFFEQVIEQYQQEHNTSAQSISAALTYLLQLERPLQYTEPKPSRSSHSVRSSERSERSPRSGRSRSDRPERSDRPARSDSRQKGKAHSERAPDEGMARFRIEVGRDQEAMPKDIVGAIVNETGIDSRDIGHIKLHDAYSTVDLPADMPRDIFQHLKKVRVKQQALRISLVDEHDAPELAKEKPKREKKPRYVSKNPSDKQPSDKKTGEKKPKKSKKEKAKKAKKEESKVAKRKAAAKSSE